MLVLPLLLPEQRLGARPPAAGNTRASCEDLELESGARDDHGDGQSAATAAGAVGLHPGSRQVSSQHKLSRHCHSFSRKECFA